MSREQRADFEVVSMHDGEDFLFRPVMRGMFTADRLVEPGGRVDLAFVALCNEAIDIEQENQLRARKAAERKAAIARQEAAARR